MLKLIKAHKFFCRKSQHYIMDNWNCYEKWVSLDGAGKGYKFNKRKLYYYKNFIPAYFKFMYLSILNK